MSRKPTAKSLSHNNEQEAWQALAELPAESAVALKRWLDGLAELPLDHWIAVGRACARDVSARQRRTTSTALLEAVIADQHLELTAWFIGDMVHTAAHSAATTAARARRSARHNFAFARAAADWAALAIATRSWLPEVDHDALCAPFDAVLGDGALRLV